MLGLLTATACATSTETGPPRTTAHRGNVPPANITWDVELRAGWLLEERVCWENARISVVMPEDKAGLRYVVSAFDDEGRVLDVTARGAPVGTASCAVLTIDLARAAVELDDDDALTMAGGALFGSPDVWLWRPEPWPAGALGKLTLRLPQGMAASLPWPRDDDGRFLVDQTTWKMMCKGAFGRLAPRTITAAGATFTLTKLPGELSASDEGLERWLTKAAGAVSLVSGSFPVPHAQILLVPVDGGGAIPFGMAMRGGGPTAMMFVSSRATDDDLDGEWVGVHELSHLLLPPVNREDAWLSEGLASYYQEVLRGRAGIHDAGEAWEYLVGGFVRGRRAARDMPLGAASARMFDDHAFFHVYWGGAAVLFRLDVELRKRGRSLDEVVAAVRAREPRDVRYRSAEELVSWMAEAAPDVDVRGLVARALEQRFPAVDDLLADLGVERLDGGGVRLHDDAPFTQIRRAIVPDGAR